MTQTQVTDVAAPNEEDAAFILGYAQQRGWKISRAQMERRHRAGVISRPRQQARGRGPGTVTIYPAGTAALLVEGLEIGGPRMPLRQLAFELWLRGQPVPSDGVRAHLSALATLHDRIVGVIRFFGFGRAVLPERALRFVERLAGAHPPAAMRSMHWGDRAPESDASARRGHADGISPTNRLAYAAVFDADRNARRIRTTGRLFLRGSTDAHQHQW